jgi:hypothetical protein
VIPVTVTDADGIAVSASLPLTVVSPFAEWKTRMGLPADFPEQIDPEDVGIPALLRHALGVDQGWEGLPWGAVDVRQSTFRLQRNLGATDAVIQVWRSHDLSAWDLVYQISPDGESAHHDVAGPVERQVAGQVENLIFQVEGATPDQPVFLRVSVLRWE